LAYFRVEGTSRVHWSLLVEAASEDEAADIARRTAGNQSELRREDALQDVHHQVEQPLTLAMGASPDESPQEQGRSVADACRDEV